jgi:hypothetical protein
MFLNFLLIVEMSGSFNPPHLINKKNVSNLLQITKCSKVYYHVACKSQTSLFWTEIAFDNI